MPSLPHVSGAEVVRALKTLGFVVARQRGSHIVLRRGARGCVVPNHREIKTGTTLRHTQAGRSYRGGIHTCAAEVTGSNFCDIDVYEKHGNVVVMAALDNLAKGMAGQAIQNIDIIFDLSEREGLNCTGIYPI